MTDALPQAGPLEMTIEDVGVPLPIPDSIPDATGFGCAVGAANGRVVVGVDGRRDGLRPPGLVVGFTFDDVRWTCSGLLRSPESAVGDEFGAALRIEGDRLLVGSPGAGDRRGLAWCFEWSGDDGWGRARALRPRQIDAGDRFGDTVEFHGDRVVVGMPRDDVDGMIDAGRVDVFDVTMNAPVPVARLQSDAPRMGGRFGSSLAIGPEIAVGAIGASPTSPADGTIVDRAGIVHLFSPTPPFSKVSKIGRDVPGNLDRTGTAISYFKRTLIVGSPRARTEIGRSGVVTVFDGTRREYLDPSHPDGGLGSSLAAMPPLLAFTVPGHRDESGRVDGCVRIGTLHRNRFHPLLDVVGFGDAGTELVLAADPTEHRLVIGAPGQEEDDLREGRAWTIEFEPVTGPPRFNPRPRDSTDR